MSDLIERQAAKEALQKAIDEVNHDLFELEGSYGYCEMVSSIGNALDGVPAAQPEIIRCKDCSKRPYCRTSTVWAVVPDDDWFCGDAERNLEEIPDTRGNRIEQPHWIPCSEKLPEANGRYLVTRGLNACGSLWKRIYIVNYSDLMGLKSERIWWDGNVGKSDFERIEDVIAWMPLPKPYKEDV